MPCNGRKWEMKYLREPFLRKGKSEYNVTKKEISSSTVNFGGVFNFNSYGTSSGTATSARFGLKGQTLPFALRLRIRSFQ